MPIKHTPCDAMHKAGCLLNPTGVLCFPILLWVEIYHRYYVRHLLYTFLTSLAFINCFTIASHWKGTCSPFVSAIFKFPNVLSFPLSAQTKVIRKCLFLILLFVGNRKKKMALPFGDPTLMTLIFFFNKCHKIRFGRGEPKLCSKIDLGLF